MSVSCSDSCDMNLLCGEDSSIFSDECPESWLLSSDIESSACSEESIAGLVEDEIRFVPGVDYLARFNSHSLDASAREESVAWIRKVQAFYNFQPLTAYLAVNYMDRFLDTRQLPQKSGWPMQLLSVACLSLAAKMEESLVPTLLDLQVAGAKYVFEPKTILRMEFLVLGVLDWRLRSVTPFCFLGFFACKIDSTRDLIGVIVSRASEIILSNIKDASFVEYLPSTIAAAATLCAASEIPNLTLVKPEHAESWCDGLSKEKISDCYCLMQALRIDKHGRKLPKLITQLRVTVRARVSSSTDSSSVSSSPSSHNKKRKLNNWSLENLA